MPTQKKRAITPAVKWFLAPIFLLVACVSVEPPPPLDIRAKDVLLDQVDKGLSSYQESLLNLENFAPSGSYKGNLVKDIRAYIYARMAYDKGDDEQYGFYLEESLRVSEGRFAQVVFDEWFSLQARLAKKSEQSPEDFVRDVLLTIENKQLGNPLKSLGLLANESLNKKAAALTGSGNLVKKSKEIESPKPMNKGLQIAVRENYLAELCKLDQPNLDIFLVNLKAHELSYSRGVIALCKNDHDTARNYFKSILADSSINREPGFRFAIIKKLIQSFKATGDRELVSENYKLLFAQNYPLEKAANDWNLTKFEAFLRLCDDRLWAARNRALTGNYAEATTHASFVVEETKNWEERKGVDRSQIELLRNIRAEALQTLATRIEVEQGNLDKAINFLLLGNDLRVKDKDTAERFVWLIGLYRFMNGEFASAKKSWIELLALTKQDGTRARLYFWIARACEKLGEPQGIRSNLELLANEYPLSFYNIVAVKEAKLEGRDWSETFAGLSPTTINLVDSKRFDLNELREREPKALLRAELAIAAKLSQEILQPLVRDLSSTLQDLRSRLDRSLFAKAQIYLSRLQLAAGMYAHSFASTGIADSQFVNFYKQWPDQIFVLYPRPYNEIMSREARSHPSLIANISFAIARQESSFNAKVTSGAGAIGLLQLIPPTALRFAGNSNDSIDTMAKRLLEPEDNVRIGTAYLSFLSDHFGGSNHIAIAAAYNAGEYAVDAWLARRKIKDPLTWIEAIPFGETQGYVKNVWRNLVVYDFLQRMGARVAWNFDNNHGPCHGASCLSF